MSSPAAQQRERAPSARPDGSELWTDPRFDQWKQGRYVPRCLKRSIDDLEAYHREDIRAIADRYWEKREREERALTDPNAEAAHYYETTDRYVYESSYFETYAEYQWYFETVRRACAQFRKAPVLDFGGGAGGLALTLSLAGIPCDYADIPGPTSEFVRWRLKRHGCASRVLDATQPLPAGRYAAIATLDVFEHLGDLKRTLAQLTQALAPGGWLISKSTFAPDDPFHLPQNLVYADIRVFNRLLDEMGLTYLGRVRPDPVSEQAFKWWQRPRIWRVWLDPKPKFGGRFTVHQLRGDAGSRGAHG